MTRDHGFRHGLASRVPRWSVAALLLLLLCPAGAVARSEAREFLERLVAKIEAGPSSISSVLRQYNQVERSGRWDIFARHELHRGLLAALRKVDDPAFGRQARSFLKLSDRTHEAAKILLLKTVPGDRFPASREERIEMLLAAAKGRHVRLSLWGVRLLADSRWPEAVDALIDLLRHEEVAGKAEMLRWNMVSSELYRLMGTSAPQGTPAGTIREIWEKMGRKLPSRPVHGIAPVGSVTVSFFGDLISPNAVFAIDASTSMRQLATMSSGEGRGATTVKGKERRPSGPREKKVVIVKRELERALQTLRPHYKFNVLGYNSTYIPWKGSGSLKLYDATSRNLGSAIQFTRDLAVDPGTNIHDSVSAALTVPEVETIYLLSDGKPSVGGGPEKIERRVAALNYLLGVRIVTYGFTPEGGGSFDEGFMKRLAAANWGWYRRLNR